MSFPDTPADGRQRRLDDLFGDEPFLSTTMRARLLVTGSRAIPDETRATASVEAPAPEPLTERQPAPLELQRFAAAPEWTHEPDREPEWGSGELEPTARLLRTAEALVARNRLAEAVPPTTVCEPDRTVRQAQRDRPVLRIDREPGCETMSLSEAAAMLRSESAGRMPSRRDDMLDRLRSEVLLRWLKELPPRPAETAREER